MATASNDGRRVWDPACDDVGWPRKDDGHWLWKFHDLRHVFATGALDEAAREPHRWVSVSVCRRETTALDLGAAASADEGL